MRIARCSAVALAVCVGLIASVANAQVTLTYDPADGNVMLESAARGITTFEAKSAGNLFVPGGVNDGVILPPFDVLTAEKLFKLSAGAGFLSVDFGKILPAGLTADALSADMSINGSLAPDGSGNNGLDAAGLSLVVVPEPSTIALVCCGLLGLLGLRRK